MKELFVCSACGEKYECEDGIINGWDYGVKLTYSDSDSYGFSSHCLCKECADIIVPIFKKANEKAKKEIRRIAKQSTKPHPDIDIADLIEAIMEA